jgi:hypothetical protein
MAAANWHSDLHDLGISLEQVIDHSATTSRVDREIQRHFQQRMSAASATPRRGRLSGTRRAPLPVSDLDLVRRTLRMRQLGRPPVAEGMVDLGLGLGAINTSG